MSQASFAFQNAPIHYHPHFYLRIDIQIIYALTSAGASELSALGASVAGSPAGTSAAGSASDDVQRV